MSTKRISSASTRPPSVARHRAHQDADGGRDHRGEEADQQADLAALEHARGEVAAVEVGAEPVRALARGLRHLRAAAADGELSTRRRARGPATVALHPQRDVGARRSSPAAPADLGGGATAPRRLDDEGAARRPRPPCPAPACATRRSAAARRSRGPGDRRCGPTPAASPSGPTTHATTIAPITIALATARRFLRSRFQASSQSDVPRPTGRGVGREGLGTGGVVHS